jgi:PAS domain S-box-containing protein
VQQPVTGQALPSGTAEEGAGAQESTLSVSTAVLSQRNDNLFSGIVIFTFITIVVMGSGAFWIIRSFSDSLKRPAFILDNLVRGDTSANIAPTKDEFADIIKAANQLRENLDRSSNFAKSIGDGEVNFEFVPVSEQDTLGNSLVQMREKLKGIAEEDKKRNWSTAGLALFADFIRKQEDQKTLAYTLISELVKYTKSNQGGLFHLNSDNDKDPYLELIACYAYERKKFLTKRIDIGTGLVGQCFLEGETVYLTKIPQDYVSITSGLGNGNPTSLLIIPLKLNESIEGVIELASFKKYEPHEIEFVKRVGEIIASAISASRITEHTKRMLAESQQQSEEMRSQEEEMRQNMEEMQATQEAMERQTNEIKKMQVSLELEKSMFNVLMEFLPDRITYKDTESRIMRINKAKAQRINMSPEEVIGKTDYDFFSREHAEKAMREEKALIDSGKPLVDIEERLVFNNGDTAWVSTSRIPFKNEHNKTTGMFIITKDITKLKIAELSLKDRDTIIQRLLTDLPVFHYKINKDRIIYEAWTGDNHEGFPQMSELLSKPVRDIFPQVSRCIDGENDGTQMCSDTFGNRPFKHYIFADSVIAGSFWVYAVAGNS